jgi:hypothetical protein
MTKTTSLFFVLTISIGCGSDQKKHPSSPQHHSKSRTVTDNAGGGQRDHKKTSYKVPSSKEQNEGTEPSKRGKAASLLNDADRICTAYENYQMVGDKDMAFNQGQVLAEQGLEYSELLLRKIELRCGGERL